MRLLTHILFQFHRLGDVKIPVVIENQYLVFFSNETSSGVMNFKGPLLSSSKSSKHSFRPVTLLRAGAQEIEEFRQTNIEGSLKDVLGFDCVTISTGRLSRYPQRIPCSPEAQEHQTE